MKIAIVNACHPERQHVCAFRGTAFAEHLADLGNRVVLITPPLTETGKGVTPEELEIQIDGRSDWSTYLHVMGGIPYSSILPAVRNGTVPTPIRQSIIAYNYLRHGNIYNDWMMGMAPLMPIIADRFVPEIIWAIFGNTSCLVLGRKLAKMTGCPWIADIKDNWQEFVPKGLRKIVAGQISDSTHTTLLSEAHRETYPDNGTSKFTTIYNGISDDLMKFHKAKGQSSEVLNEILISGSLYDFDALSDLLRMIVNWLPPKGNVHLTYAGGDTEIIQRAKQTGPAVLPITILGKLSPPELWARQRRANINVYVRNPPNLFHHKLLELICVGRPILAYGGETAESIRIAKDIGADLFPCSNEVEVDETLNQSFSKNSDSNLDRSKLEEYSTKFQAKKLNQLLSETVAKYSTTS